MAFPALLLGLCLGCSGAQHDPPPPNVVLLVMDTVRADHVSCYGYAQPTTPHLDGLAQASVRYTRCHATGPWTLPSHASMFTGRYAFQHLADSLPNEEGQWAEWPLNAKHTTLAEALNRLGYRTGGFVANIAYLRQEYQLDQGFEHYVVKRETGLEKNAAAFEWLGEAPEPFFLFLNYMDAHRPYNTADLPDGRLALPNGVRGESSPQLLKRLIEVVMGEGQAAPPPLLRDVTACYDLGIANADLALGGVIAELKRRAVWDNTLLIVTSDHGEFLAEHGLVEHSKDVYEEVLWVPLVCKQPGSEASSVNEDLLSLADLPRLVASFLPPSMGAELQLSFPLPLQRDSCLAEINLSREHDMRASYGARFRRRRQVLYTGKHKLIVSSDGEHELYDLEQDPREQRNLYDGGSLARRLSRQLADYLRAHPAQYPHAEAAVFDAAATRALRELGYAGSDE